LPKKVSYVFGEKISIEVSTQIKSNNLSKIELFYNNKLISETTDNELILNDYELNSLGDGIIKVIVTKTDGTNTSKPVSVKTLSNISPKKYTYQVINSYPHLTTSYTQGLEYYNEYLYEGTGEYGSSNLYQINLKTGQPLKSFYLDDDYFGEGITILNKKIYQLTYFAQTAFVYNLTDFSVIDSFKYASKEGWGLTNDGENLIMSNGSHHLIWLNPTDFTVIKTLQVANNNGIKSNLNELEYIDGTIYANIYTTNTIVQIDAETGRVLSEINLTGLLNLYNSDQVDYMNGIAYDKENDRLFVTGKFWPRLFEIKLVPSE
jgi:glutamine cyclotransferase